MEIFFLAVTSVTFGRLLLSNSLPAYCTHPETRNLCDIPDLVLLASSFLANKLSEIMPTTGFIIFLCSFLNEVTYMNLSTRTRSTHKDPILFTGL